MAKDPTTMTVVEIQHDLNTLKIHIPTEAIADVNTAIIAKEKVAYGENLTKLIDFHVRYLELHQESLKRNLEGKEIVTERLRECEEILQGPGENLWTFLRQNSLAAEMELYEEEEKDLREMIEF